LSASSARALSGTLRRERTVFGYGVTGKHIGLDTWRTREWYAALDAAGIARRGRYHLPPHVRDRGAGRPHLHLGWRG
jgi:hypothetical protein